MPIEVNRTGDDDIDGILWGWRWDFSDFTFSFPRNTANYQGYAGIEGFQGFGDAQQAATRKILNHVESFCDVRFTEAEPSQGVANFRFAEARKVNYTNDPGLTAFPGLHRIDSAEANPPEDYYFGKPPTAPIFSQGDSWYNRSDYDDVRLGTFAYSAGLMHETGHNLGLKHGHTTQSGHGTLFPELPFDHDSLEYSVMTYNQFPGDSEGIDTAPDHPTTYMQDDILALQMLYGANYKYQSGNTVYQWAGRSGEMLINGVGQGAPEDNHILMTVWDGGGRDTYDLSNFVNNVFIDLRPGQWTTTSTAQLADLGTDKAGGAHHFARGTIANAQLFQGNTASLIEDAVGGSGNDRMIGNQANNLLDGGKGADVMDGRQGDDTYVVDNSADRVVESVGRGRDTVISTISYALAGGQEIEVLQLARSTGSAALKLQGNEFANSLSGNNGANSLDGGRGADMLLGKGGADTFVFATKLGGDNIDHIIDFSVVDDTIRLSASVFTALSRGELASGEFKTVAGAKSAVVDGNDHVLYDKGTGDLFYDADGGNAGGRVKFAVIDTHAALTFHDFLIA